MAGVEKQQITEELQKCGFEIINDGIKCNWTPDEETLEKCVEFGKQVAKA